MLAFLGLTSALTMPGLGQRVVQPLPPAGFVWADDAFTGRIVPTSPVRRAAKAKAKVKVNPSPAKVKEAPPAITMPDKVTVSSWYDSGIRLQPDNKPSEAMTAGASLASKLVSLLAVVKAFMVSMAKGVTQKMRALFVQKEQWPALGGSGGPHRMRGPWPPPPPRELWEPPEGWTPPSKAVSVISWYDNGKRLTPPVVSWYDAGKRL